MAQSPDLSIFKQEPWKALGVPDLGAAALVPTMLNMDEQTFYVWLTREWAKGQGAIVDLGSFAGGSAACLAEGVRQAGRADVVHGYDKYTMEDYDVFRARYASYLEQPPASLSNIAPRDLPDLTGDDLSPVVRFLLEPWGQGFELHKGQIEDEEWSGGAIEVLVMDASKTAETMDRMSATFFPHLIPGQSIVVQQDFLWWQQPWIAVQMTLLKDFFTPVAYIPNHSVSFLCIEEISADAISLLNVAGMEDDSYIETLREAKQLLKPFGIDWYMRRLIKGLRANPGARKAFQMKAKPVL